MGEKFEDISSSIVDKINDVSIKNEVVQFIKCVKVHQETPDVHAERWLDWAKENKNLKIVSFPLPGGILPKECPAAELLDVKVACRGPDDALYDKHQLIRQRVARGNCFMRIDSGTHKGTRLVLYGLKKFTGGLGDDDDRDKGDDYTWRHYFTKPVDSARCIVATRKANGEAAHMSCLKLAGEVLICAGSKNVHMLFRTREDIKLYLGDRFRIAGEVCEAIVDLLEQMEPEDKDRLLTFLSATGYTAIFEILSPDHQHVEDFSHLPCNRLQFITWTAPDLDPASDSKLCIVPPHIGIEIARALGLPTVDYRILPVQNVESHMKQIRQGYQYEGEVLYFLDENGSLIGLLKKKTIWYIICRAIREKVCAAAAAKVKNGSTFSFGARVQQMEKRLGEIQTWLGLEEATLTAWKTLALGFLKWSITSVDSGSVKADLLRDKFPVFWKKFLEESGNSDRVIQHYHESTSPDEEHMNQS